MEPNPYESPRYLQRVAERNRKPWLGYAAAFVVGGACALVVVLVGPPLPIYDDTGFAQTMIGGFLGVVIYWLLFPTRRPSKGISAR